MNSADVSGGPTSPLTVPPEQTPASPMALVEPLAAPNPLAPPSSPGVAFTGEPAAFSAVPPVSRSVSPPPVEITAQTLTPPAPPVPEFSSAVPGAAPGDFEGVSRPVGKAVVSSELPLAPPIAPALVEKPPRPRASSPETDDSLNFNANTLDLFAAKEGLSAAAAKLEDVLSSRNLS